jgi:biopolymer transport protein ExbB/TolQ
MDTHDLKSLVIPLMVALDLTILGMLVAVILGLAWD